MTLKAEILLSLYYRSFVGDQLAVSRRHFFNGEALSLLLEQPFYKNTWFLLGFRVMYVNDFWQTWPLFESMDEKIFYPQMILGVLL